MLEIKTGNLVNEYSFIIQSLSVIVSALAVYIFNQVKKDIERLFEKNRNREQEIREINDKLIEHLVLYVEEKKREKK